MEIKKRTLLIVSFTRFVDAFGMGMLIPLSPILALYTGGSIFVSTMLAAVAPFCWIVVGPMLGAMADRYGRQRIIQVGVLINLIGYLVPIFSPTLVGLFISRFLSGIGSSNTVPAGAVFADISDESERAKYMSIRQAAFSLGLLLGPLLVPFVSSDNLFMVFKVIAVIMLVNLIMILWLPETKPNTDETFVESPGNVVETTALDLRLVIVGCLLVTLSFALIHSSLPLIITDMFIVESGLNEWSKSAFSGYESAVDKTSMAVILATSLAFLSQVFISTKAINGMGAGKIILITIGIWASVQFVTPYLQLVGWYPYLSTVVITGICYGLFYPALTTYLSLNTSRDRQGKIFGSQEAVMALAMFVGPMVSGTIASFSTASVYWVAAAIMVLALLAYLIHNTAVQKNGLISKSTV